MSPYYYHLEFLKKFRKECSLLEPTPTAEERSYMINSFWKEHDDKLLKEKYFNGKDCILTAEDILYFFEKKYLAEQN